MHDFTRIISALQNRFPGRLVCTSGRSGKADGLRIECPGVGGHVFVFIPSQGNGPYLTSLSENDDSSRSETWSVRDGDEMADKIQPWVFPSRWTAPPPVNAATVRARLAKLAVALASRSNIKCAASPLQEDFLARLTPDGREQLQIDLESHDPARIVKHFPWDRAGRLALKTIVVLNRYRGTKLSGPGREVCLAAVGPARRSDPERITIALADVIYLNQSHRWDNFRWRWTGADPPDSETIGIEGKGPARENLLALSSLQLLDEGQIEKALALYNIQLSDDLHCLIGGQRIAPPACCAHPDQRWTGLLVQTIRESAPWRLGPTFDAEVARLEEWVNAKPRRRFHTPMLRLAIFPGQFHIRKASLMLTGNQDGSGLHFLIEATGSNARPADAAWKRPLEVDLAWYGLSCD
ncbi:MAG TPA: hypothetical protein VFE47_22885 [Tepidisphaeraceae bacterium]|jgi:hypothetical protein|nr:hypothetical protein [Tepidisphaeraceae bacterium]